MDENKGIFSTARTWRDIPQEVKPRAMSKSGRKRYSLGIVKFACGVLFVAGAAWGTVALVNAFEYHPQELAKATQSAPISKLTLNTDGVLSREWVLRTLALPKRTTLMEVDLSALQSRLLSSGQVCVAVLSKTFPDTLNVTLTEHSPVARIKVQDPAGPLREMFVAPDGVVFEAEGLDPQLVDGLPWLVEGVRLVRGRNGALAPIPGMKVVSDLLTKARYEGGHLYSLLRYISLSRLESDGEIEARSPLCEGLVFSTREDFFRQLAYLDYMRDTLQPTEEAPLARVDLSHGSSVPVTFSRKPGTPATGAPGTATAQRAGATQAPRSASGKPVVASASTAQQPARPSGFLSQPPQPSAASPRTANPGPAQQAGTTRQLQAPTRPAPLPAFQNFQRNASQREL